MSEFKGFGLCVLSSLGFEIQLFTALDAVRVKNSGLQAFGIPGLGLRIKRLRPALQGSLQFHGVWQSCCISGRNSSARTTWMYVEGLRGLG